MTKSGSWATDLAVCRVLIDHRHERERTIPDAPRRRATHEKTALGPLVDVSINHEAFA
jgi:hypothetical protein